MVRAHKHSMNGRGRIRVVAVLLVLCGCGNERGLWTGHGEDIDSIQKMIEEKIRDQREAQPGAERLHRFDKNTYQDEGQLRRLSGFENTASRRRELAAQLLEAGPLALHGCMVFAMEFNGRIQAGRAEIRAVGGDELVVRSRFLPQLDYGLRHDQIERSSDTEHLFRVSQRLFEFGKENPEDITLRESQRRALFAYEDTVRDMLAGVRRVFFTVLLRQQQVAKRRELLGEFEAALNRVRKRERERMVPKSDVLTARLNVVNEKFRIIALEKELLRRKIELLRFTGLPVDTADVTLIGELEHFALEIDQSARLALSRSTSIAQARAEVYEQARLALRIWWENTPDLRVRGGVKDGRNAVGMEVSNEDGFYNVDSFIERHFESGVSGFGANPPLPDTEGSGGFLSLDLDVPVFDGFEQRGKVVREKARLTEHVTSCATPLKGSRKVFDRPTRLYRKDASSWRSRRRRSNWPRPDWRRSRNCVNWKESMRTSWRPFATSSSMNRTSSSVSRSR